MAWTTQYNSSPMFVVDWNSIDRDAGHQIDWRYVPDSYKAGTTYTFTTSGAAAAATSIPITAAPVALPTGTVLNWTGTGEISISTAPIAAGATAIPVEALDAAIEASDTAPYQVSESQDKVIAAGTVMSLLSTGKMVPRVARPGSEAAYGLLLGTAIENLRSHALSGYALIVGGVIYETLLPEVITSYKTELETNGMSWVWQTYADSSEV